MNAGKFRVFAKSLFVAGSFLALASLPANAELLVGMSFPSQGGDNDVIVFDSSNLGTILFDHPSVAAGNNDSFEIDESLLSLPKLHLQDSSWFGVENRTVSSAIISFHLHDTAFTNLIPSYAYSLGQAKLEEVRSYFTGLTVREQLPPSPVARSVSAKGTPNSAAAPDSSISGSASPAQPAASILNVTLNQNTLQLDWPADHIGWILQTQTNPGINSQWFPVIGSSATNHLELTLDRANASVFFRLVAP
jgi:hypothetical protein